MLRGLGYPTTKTARCPSFHQCEYCKGCTRYNQHALACNRCESRKLPEQVCHHTDKQQLTVVRMNELTRGLMAHPDQQSKRIEIPLATNPQWDQLANDMITINES